MLRRTARGVGIVGALIPVVGLVLSYYLSCVREGTPFGVSPWSYVPVALTGFPAGLLLVPFWILKPELSFKGAAVHVFWPLMAAIYSILNFYIGYYTVVLSGALIRRIRNGGRDRTGMS